MKRLPADATPADLARAYIFLLADGDHDAAEWVRSHLPPSDPFAHLNAPAPDLNSFNPNDDEPTQTPSVGMPKQVPHPANKASAGSLPPKIGKGFNPDEPRNSKGEWAKIGDHHQESDAIVRHAIPKTPDSDAGEDEWEIHSSAVGGFYSKVESIVDSWVDRSTLSEATKQKYATDLKRCFTAMSPASVKAALKNMRGHSPIFYKNITDLTAATPDAPSGHSVGGSWEWRPAPNGHGYGVLHLDGDSIFAEAFEVYAHEIGHAIDGSGWHSNSREWQDAWGEEINRPNNPLSLYAKTSPAEGWAEFNRLLVTSPGMAEEKFPKSYAAWKSRGVG